MVDPEWQGGKKDQRLYRKVRAEKQKVIRKKYDVIQAHLNEHAKGIRVSKDEMTQVQVKPASFHGEWNYTIVPRTPNMEI